jgi:hypothetical protein
MQRLKAALFLVLIGFGMGGALSGCVLEDDHGGHEHHDHDWR